MPGQSWKKIDYNMDDLIGMAKVGIRKSGSQEVDPEKLFEYILKAGRLAVAEPDGGRDEFLKFMQTFDEEIKGSIDYDLSGKLREAGVPDLLLDTLMDKNIEEFATEAKEEQRRGPAV